MKSSFVFCQNMNDEFVANLNKAFFVTFSINKDSTVI